MLGTARAFWGPAAQSLAPNLVPPEALANAITVNCLGLAVRLDRRAGGGRAALRHRRRAVPFGTGAALLVCRRGLRAADPQAGRSASRMQATSLDTMLGGFRYIFSNKVVLGAISLDMFAVLMGGAVALLPVYAKDILHAGPLELGFLRAAPGIGAIVDGAVC